MQKGGERASASQVKLFAMISLITPIILNYTQITVLTALYKERINQHGHTNLTVSW